MVNSAGIERTISLFDKVEFACTASDKSPLLALNCPIFGDILTGNEGQRSGARSNISTFIARDPKSRERDDGRMQLCRCTERIRKPAQFSTQNRTRRIQTILLQGMFVEQRVRTLLGGGSCRCLVLFNVDSYFSSSRRDPFIGFGGVNSFV